MFSTVGVLLICCAGFAFFSTDLTSEDTYRDEVESVEGQNLLDRSFPSGTTAPTNIVVADPAEISAVTERVESVNGVEAVSPPVASGLAWHADPGDPRTQPVLDRRLRPGRTDAR
jgi:putative drug exporter of the RND superfamily